MAQRAVSVYSAGDLGSIPGSGRFPGEGNGNPLQYSCLENPMDGGAWCRLLSMGSQRVGPTERFPFPFTQPTYTVLDDKEAFAILKACLGATSSGLPLVCKIVSTFGKGAFFAMIE